MRILFRFLFGIEANEQYGDGIAESWFDDYKEPPRKN
jgi:hypothetical protein